MSAPACGRAPELCPVMARSVFEAGIRYWSELIDSATKAYFVTARRVFGGIALCVAATFVAPTGMAQTAAVSTAPGKIHALLIANWDYALNVGRLRAPADDAELIRQAVLKAGVPHQNVLSVSNVGIGELRAAARRFAERLRGAQAGAVGFFYFAGHGAAGQYGGDNLVPIDVRDAAAPDFWQRTYPIAELMRTLAAEAPESQFVIVIDACRAPLALDGILARRRGFRGVAAQQVPDGILLTYATQAGQSARDDGRYAQALGQELVAAGRSVQEVFLALRERLAKETRGEQLPWLIDKLRGQIALAGGNPDPNANVRFEVTGASRVVFFSGATPLYSSPNVDGGLLEVKAAGAVHRVTDAGGRIYLVRDGGLLKWVAFQSEYGPAYALREQVLID